MSSPNLDPTQEFYQTLTVYIGADHRGRFSRDVVANILTDWRVRWKDVTNLDEDEGDDYPDYAEPVAQSVSYNQDSLGVLICGSGHGMCIAANKVKGIRAAVCHTAREVELARSHNHINVLCIAADTIDETKLVGIMRAFLDTVPSDAERHIRRLNKVLRIEQDLYKPYHN